MRTGIFTVAVLLGALLTPARPASAGERYYIILFGSESVPKRLEFTHTWATFVKVVGEGPDPANYQIAYHTISWLPATLRIRVFAPHPETGVNLDLYTTLDYVLRNGESVDVWVPMRVDPSLYERSVVQYHRLLSGAVRYQAIDPPNDDVYDCIHANSALDPDFGQFHYPLSRVGKPATAYIAKQIGQRGDAFDPTDDARWLLSRLGIDRYPVNIIHPAVRVSSGHGCR